MEPPQLELLAAMLAPGRDVHWMCGGRLLPQVMRLGHRLVQVTSVWGSSHLLPQFRNVEAGVHSTGHGCLADGAA